MSNKILSVFILIFFIFVSVSAYAEWSDFFQKSSLQEKVPLPRSSKKIHSANPIVTGHQFNTTVYTSDLSQAEIEEFYNEKLSRAGWDKVSMPVNEEARMVNMVIFTKNERIVSITFLPISKLRGQTTFSVSEGTVSPPEEPLDKSPQKLDFMPLYPGAEQVMFTESMAGVSAGYTSKDSIRAVIDFYKREMPLKGWALQREVEPGSEKFDLQYKQCPTCADYPQVQTSMLQFSKDNGGICIIGATRMPASEEQVISETAINVNYVKGQ